MHYVKPHHTTRTKHINPLILSFPIFVFFLIIFCYLVVLKLPRKRSEINKIETVKNLDIDLSAQNNQNIDK
jgi:hypothetical protein